MPRDRPLHAMWWIGIGAMIVVALLIFAAFEWNYLPRSWRGLAWLAFIGLPAWISFEWMGDRLAANAKGRPWWWQALGLVVLIGVVALILWLMPATP
jgi:hypothetical protein